MMHQVLWPYTFRPQFWYHPNSSKNDSVEAHIQFHVVALKIHLLWKQEHDESANPTHSHFVRGKSHVQATLGSRRFTVEYASNKTQSWAQEIASLPEVATTQLHAAYAAFTSGLPRHWSCISRTIPIMEDPTEKGNPSNFDFIHRICGIFRTGR